MSTLVAIWRGGENAIIFWFSIAMLIILLALGGRFIWWMFTGK